MTKFCKRLFVGFSVFLFVAVILSGCQQKDTQPEPEKQLSKPFSNGPSGPPSVKGPSGPPPESVTHVENIEFILPEDE